MRAREFVNDLSSIVQSFVSSPLGQQYQKHDCKTVTRAFVQWAEQNNIPTEVITFAPPSADFIKKYPQFRGKSGQGDGHIMPVVNGNAIDFTVRQFGVNRPFDNPLITPVGNLRSVYGKFGYFTDAPEWFLGGKSYWQGPLSAIPSEIFNQNFGDELLENFYAQGVTESLDQPYRLAWKMGIHGDVDAYATLPDGTPLSIMFNKENEHFWTVEFYRSNSQGVTGEGDSQRIFATVLGAIKKFIKKYQPRYIVFSAVKEDDPTGRRASLYERMVQKYARQLGYEIEVLDEGYRTTFTLYQSGSLNESVAEGVGSQKVIK
jgi:hypothetical protein